MQPLVRAALAAAVLAALGSLGKTEFDKHKKDAEPAPFAPAPFAPPMPVACGPHTVPEGNACLPLPKPGETNQALGEPREPSTTAAAALIPRRPDRPAAPSAYRFPLSNDAAPVVLGGLDQPLGLDVREGPKPLPSAVFLGAASGAEVVALSLTDQEGPSEVAFLGDLFGATIITAHLVRDGGKLRQILLVHGNLSAFAAALTEGLPLTENEVLGTVGESGWPGRPGLYLEVLELREGTSLGTLSPAQLRDEIKSVPTDPRNRLPLR